MTTWSDFRDARLGREIVPQVRADLDRAASRVGRKLRLMEVCGTHTIAISRSGIRDVLAREVDLVSGPGCPVCVTDYGEIDHMIALARVPGAILTTFGDMMKVPGSTSDLTREKTGGADVRVVYAPLDALRLAEENPDREVIFLGVGFETTAPAVAVAMHQAATRGVWNFSVFSAHKLTPPAVKALLPDPELRVDGFLLPGHVSVVIGRASWDFLAREHGIPGVVAGFELLDVLSSVGLLARQIAEGRAEVLNNYPRAVREEGNRPAQELLRRYFLVETASWRGLGSIPESGMAIRPEYAHLDAARRFEVDPEPLRIPRGCQCGEILKGKKTPFDCRLFGKACTPEHPVGPCMVSSEGACATYHRYERKEAAS